ncbi:MAG: glycosyltransferase family 4 protein [Bdellovibrionia bacterium]
MKILHAVEFYWPHIGGAQEVVRRLSEEMVRLGHHVTVATTHLPERKSKFHNGVQIEEFKVRGNWTQGMEGEVERYREWVNTEKFDVIMMYAAQQWTTDALLPHLQEISGRKVLVPCGFSGLHVDSYREYFLKLKEWLKSVDRCVILSDSYQDTRYLKEAGYNKIQLIPNGAAAEEFNEIHQRRGRMRVRLGINKETRLLLHVGSHTGFKGHDELIQAFRQARVSDAHLLIVGNRLSRRCHWKCQLSEKMSRIDPRLLLQRKRIDVLELSRDEVLDAYADADLFTFFSNVECSPIVLFEAAAAGAPFLASSAGNSQEISEWLGSGEVLSLTEQKEGKAAVSVQQATQALERLLSNPAALKDRGAKGREAWHKGYTWEAITKRYLDLYSEVI